MCQRNPLVTSSSVVIFLKTCSDVSRFSLFSLDFLDFCLAVLDFPLVVLRTIYCIRLLFFPVSSCPKHRVKNIPTREVTKCFQ